MSPLPGATNAPPYEKETNPAREGDSPRVIKKYSNRRLYDTYISAYVTLEDIHSLVMDDIEFQVVDVKTGKDLTRKILLQIIAGQETQRGSLFSVRALSDIIRCYNESLQSTTSEFLHQGMELLFEQQRDIHRRMQEMTTNPARTMNEIIDQNLAIWGDMQQNFFRSMNLTGKDEVRHGKARQQHPPPGTPQKNPPK